MAHNIGIESSLEAEFGACMFALEIFGLKLIHLVL